MDEQALQRALSAIQGTLRLFWPERFAYLGGAIFALILLCFAAWKKVNSPGFDLAQAGYLFGAGGLFAVSAGSMMILLRPTFNLMNDLIRHANGLQPDGRQTDVAKTRADDGHGGTGGGA